MNYNLESILKQLHQDTYVTAAQIGSALGISEKTVRTRIKELKMELADAGAQVLAKQNAGYYLAVADAERYAKWRAKQEAPDKIPDTQTDRVRYLLTYLLDHPEYVKLDELSEALYVSRNTLTADLKRVEYFLHMYHLELERRPNHGIRVLGEEFSRRTCITNCLVKNNGMRSEAIQRNTEVGLLAGVIKDILRRYRVRMSELSFENLVLHTYVAVYRIQKGMYIRSIEVTEELRGAITGQALEVAEELVRQIEKNSGVHFPESEKWYLAIHISGKSASDTVGQYGANLVISSRIDELVLRMLSVIYEVNGLDFRDNLELRMSLNQHMVPFDIRMKYDIPLQNPILEQVKREYAFAYTIAALGCGVLREYYGKDIIEDEIGYFAILFALMIEKQDKNITKRNIVVICVSGRGSAQLFMYKYQKAFGRYINHIYQSTVYEVENFDFAGKNIDYVFTTVPLNVPLPVPIFQISMFMETEEVDNYRRLFERDDLKVLNDYYDENLFLPGLHADGKEEVLRKMCEHLANYRVLPEKFYESVLKREEMGQTDFGNLVAMPHTYRSMMKERFVMVAVLDRPIWWGHNDVQVVLLISLSSEEDGNIEKFYQITTEFIFHPKAVKELIETPTFTNMIRLLSNL